MDNKWPVIFAYNDSHRIRPKISHILKVVCKRMLCSDKQQMADCLSVYFFILLLYAPLFTSLHPLR